ncbi:MAG: isoprenylcysteine carboxylmethyltransferase family protein [Bacteroidales bacterium]|nr:isoprenylcysteine carboxylmethyltransferase family protein [Bacteroidales bacterium]MBN2699424.1 isoprenylcysteine carboxylmethyltransferase family protein [Bacteroidales bacterium]
MLNSIEKIIYLSLFLLFLIVREYFKARYRKIDYKKSKVKVIDVVLLAFNGIAMIIPLIYVFSAVFDFANYNRPSWINIIGIIILIIATICLWMSHRDLGSNWTPTLGIKTDHELVKKGIYKHIRHPMYSAHIIWAIGQMVILPNWIAGFSFILFAVLVPLLRIRDEEDLMIGEFGEAYKEYIHETGSILPRIKRIE